MKRKQIFSWIFGGLAVSISVFGLFWLSVIVCAIVSFLIGVFFVLYSQHENLDKFLDNGLLENPLDGQKRLGLNLVAESKPIVLISPNIKIQTESCKNKNLPKKSFIDSGIDLLFKKHTKTPHKDVIDHSNAQHHHKTNPIKILENKDLKTHSCNGPEEKSWNPFENIKIYTEKRKSNNEHHHHHHQERSSVDNANVSYGEECSNSFLYQPPNKETKPNKPRTIMSGNKKIDQLLHQIIDYVLRDFIDSWYNILSDNPEFNEVLVRKSIEDFILNICNRTKSQSTSWLSLLTTDIVEEVATHSKLYRLASQSVAAADKEEKLMHEKNLSPQRRSKRNQHQQQHKRNKSDTEVNWFTNNLDPGSSKNIANSKFYSGDKPQSPPKDPEMRLIEEFFNHCDLYKNECLDEPALEKYLTQLTEKILFFTLSKEDFSCLPLRTFLATVIGAVVVRPICEMLADPDFINLQIARLFDKEPPSSEYLIKMIRQCSDYSELKAVRCLVTKEMDLKFKNSSSNPELSSLKYLQKLIDMRISQFENCVTAVDSGRYKDSSTHRLPILSLDEILDKELALSYYLDYLSGYNLQQYAIFYLMAQEWKHVTAETIEKSSKTMKEDVMKTIREKAWNMYDEYLSPNSQNHVSIDSGLVETLLFKLKDINIIPDHSWFDSVSKFIYEKIKNEDAFLQNFYKSFDYKKLILELDLGSSETSSEHDLEMNLNIDLIGSDTNSSDNQFDDDDDYDGNDEELRLTAGERNHDIKFTISSPKDSTRLVNSTDLNLISSGFDLSRLPLYSSSKGSLEVSGFKHSRSHSDCTEIVKNIGSKTRTLPNLKTKEQAVANPLYDTIDSKHFELETSHKNKKMEPEFEMKQKISAKIINTAIHSAGQYAVYAIQVCVVEQNQQKSWHIYRRYSRFLELKKILAKKFPEIEKVQFPAKKAFQNTQRTVLEHRMSILNVFLEEICKMAETIDGIFIIARDFVEQNQDDKNMHGGVVVRTFETIVNPFKSGIRTIRNIPDNFIGGLSKIFLGRSQMKEASFLQVPGSIPLEPKSSEYPALTSALKLLDEVFDLQSSSRSQWLRRGIINRLLGAPWVSHAANKKIVQTAKTMIELDKLDAILEAVLNTIWPGGKQQRRPPEREDNTKLRTRMAAKIALFALVSDDLKHVVGSETTRSGLLNLFKMLQNRKLNMRLVLTLLNNILTVLFNKNFQS